MKVHRVGALVAIIFLNYFLLQDATAQAVVENFQGKPIPYKTDTPDSELSIVNIVGITIFVLGVAWGVVLALKKFHPQFRSNVGATRKQRVKLIERHRLSHKTFLYLVEFDGQTYLLAQCADQITVVSPEIRAANASAISSLKPGP